MSSPVLCATLLLISALTFTAAQSSCKGRCGADYYRGHMCQCDYNCLSYGECCRDYESQCTTENSCKGRCGESFKRGRLCSCDPDCHKYKQCCEDYQSHCSAEETPPDEANEETFDEGNYPDDQFIPLVSPTSYPPDDPSDGDNIVDANSQIPQNPEFSDDGEENLGSNPIPEGSSGYELSTVDQLIQDSTEPTPEFSTETVTVFSQTEAMPSDNEVTQADDSSPTPSTTIGEVHTESTGGVDSATEPTQDYTDLQTSLVPTTPASSTTDLTVTPDLSTSNPTPGDTGNQSVDATASPPSVLAPTSVSSVGPGTSSELDAATSHVPSSTPAVQDATAENTTPQATTAGPTEVKPSKPTSKPQDKPNQNKPPPTKPSQAKPTPKPETKPLNIDDPRDFQADDSNDTNLCSGRPVSAVTALKNGTTVVFRGHYFWLLDRNRVPGPARGITEVWGVPSPVDTVFTRCNCQGKTYIFKGTQYWRFENDVLDPGYPKAIVTGFDGLRGHITAALSVPQYQRRKESVYFFKRGGLVQRYSYQFGTGSTCGRKPQYTVYTVRNRRVRQAVSTLGPTINIRTSWRGFPSTITAAVSTPDRREPEGYKYYVFSRSKSYNVRMDAERPVIAAPKGNTPPQSNALFQCTNRLN